MVTGTYKSLMLDSELAGYSDNISLLDRANITLHAGVYGMVNNAINLGQWAGVVDKSTQEWDLASEFDKQGQSSLSMEYLNSKAGYDLAGDLALSLIPGSAAVGAINALKATKWGMRTVGFFDGRANKLKEAISTAYETQGRAANVQDMKVKLFRNAFAQQAVEGAIVTAAIDASMNLGDTLNDEGLSSLEKLTHTATSIATGALLQGVVGGAWASRAASGELKSKAADVFNNSEAKYTFASPSPRVGGFPVQTPVGSRISHVIGEYDRISSIPTTTPLERVAQARNLSDAKNSLDSLINEMFPKTDKSETAAGMRTFIRTAAATPQGRAQLADIMSKLVRTEYTGSRPVASTDFSAIFNDVNVQRVSKQTLDDLKSQSPSTMFSTDASHLDVVGGKPTLNVLDNFGEDLMASRELAAHASVFKVSPAQRTSMLADLTQFAIERGHGYNMPVFKVLQDFHGYAKNALVQKSPKYQALKAYMVGLGDKASEIYGNEYRSFLDMETGKITDAQIVNLGDTQGFSYSRDAGTIAYKSPTAASATGMEVVVPRDIPDNLAGVDLLKYQASRVLLHADTQPVVQAVAKVDGDISKLSVADTYRLETLLASAPAKDTTLTLGKHTVTKDEALQQVAKVKSEEYNRILSTNKSLTADDVYNTLGYKDTRQSASILIAKDKPQVAAYDEYINPASALTKRRIVTLVHDKPEQDLAALTAESINASNRADMMRTFKAVSDNILGINNESGRYIDDLFPDLTVEAAEGFGDSRFLVAAPNVGNYGDMVTRAAHIGNQVIEMADTVFNADIKPALQQAGAIMANSPEARAEYAAFKAWYQTQSDKFFQVAPGVYAREDSVKSVINALTTTGSAGKSPADLLKGMTRGVHYQMVERPETINYLTDMADINLNRIAKHKLDVAAAYGNANAFDLEALYLPPTNFKYTTFMVEDATSPLSQNSSSVYRIVANSRQELEVKVREALATKPNWVRKDPGDMKEFAQAQGMWEWNGRDLNRAGAASGMSRVGGLQDVTAETDIHKILTDELAYFKRSNLAVHRSAVELRYADPISKLNTLSKQAQAQATSELGGRVPKTLDDYQQVLNTMLGSDEHGFSTWKHANNLLEDWTAKQLTVINSSIKRLRGGDWAKSIEAETEAVVNELKKSGMSMPIADATSERIARELNVTPESIKNSVSWLNHWQATFLLRLDATDAMVNKLGNIVKTGSEMQFLKTRFEAADPSVKALFDAEVKSLFGAGGYTAKTGELFTYKSMAKAYAEATKLYFTKDGKDLIDKWSAENLFKTEDKLMRDLYEEIRVSPDQFRTPSDLDTWKQKGLAALKRAHDIGVTPSKHSAALNQFVALHIAERLGTALQLNPKELNLLKFKFSRSVNTVYNATQKPRLFQGAVGTAMSLYQSYMFHTMSNLFRYADHGSVSAPVMFAALNSTFFGAQSLPGFNFINENVIAPMGNRNTDAYGAAAAALGQSQNRDLADFVMYGAGAFLLQGNMHTRGGLTPRSPILIPSSVQDVPLAQAIMKMGGSAYETASNIIHGAPVPSSLWDGLVNVGMSRPLTGLADVLRQKSVDANYNTVMYNEDLFTWASALRLVGMRPLNEQVGRDYMSRQMAYKSHDAEAKKRLGEEIRVIQTHAPEQMDNPEFIQGLIHRYSKAGGTPDRFDQFLADQLSKGDGDLYDRLDKTVRRNADALSTYRDIFGGYQ